MTQRDPKGYCKPPVYLKSLVCGRKKGFCTAGKTFKKTCVITGYIWSLLSHTWLCYFPQVSLINIGAVIMTWDTRTPRNAEAVTLTLWGTWPSSPDSGFHPGKLCFDLFSTLGLPVCLCLKKQWHLQREKSCRNEERAQGLGLLARCPPPSSLCPRTPSLVTKSCFETWSPGEAQVWTTGHHSPPALESPSCSAHLHHPPSRTLETLPHYLGTRHQHLPKFQPLFRLFSSLFSN